MEQRLLTIAEVAQKLNVSPWTLRQWDASEELPALRTQGGHRRYKESDVNQLLGIKQQQQESKETIACYVRVSSHDQKSKGDLDKQKARILEYCVNRKYNVDHILVEVGSGKSDTRPKLKQLFQLVSKRKITKVVVEHKDRLTRFNFAVYQEFLASHGVTIELIEDVLPKSYKAELVEDMLSLLASFSAKIYGKRSAGRRKERQLKVVGGQS